MIRNAWPQNACDAVDTCGRADPARMRNAEDGLAPAALRDSGLADRFCAWRGRAERAWLFSVFPLGPDDDIAAVPLDGGAVMLGVQREPNGARRVLWAVAVAPGRVPDGVAAGVAALAARGGEVHLHLLAVGGAARDRIVGELGFPRLAVARCGVPEPQTTATASGAPMNPPDWRCQRSA